MMATCHLFARRGRGKKKRAGKRAVQNYMTITLMVCEDTPSTTTVPVSGHVCCQTLLITRVVNFGRLPETLDCYSRGPAAIQGMQRPLGRTLRRQLAGCTGGPHIEFGKIHDDTPEYGVVFFGAVDAIPSDAFNDSVQVRTKILSHFRMT